MEWRDYISMDPEVLGGTSVIRGTRVPVQMVIGSLVLDGTASPWRGAAEHVFGQLAAES